MDDVDTGRSVEDAIDHMTTRFAADGKVLEAAVAARYLANHHPDCGLATAEIERMVEEAAGRNKAVLLAGRREMH
jgi:hypothetical protein